MYRNICLTILLVAIAAPSFGQRITATIRGTVTDSTGAVLPGASVTAKGEETGFTRSTVTNQTGSYSFPELPTVNYIIEVSLSGFKTAIRKGITLNVAD